jgi:hypothetical protein
MRASFAYEIAIMRALMILNWNELKTRIYTTTIKSMGVYSASLTWVKKIFLLFCRKIRKLHITNLWLVEQRSYQRHLTGRKGWCLIPK